ncbi:acetylornithine aminotransferase [Gymnopilus junonius]|uniref:Acetylornithine aminotransferase n=1 Tax=Gymnopilus junonius TaxID=109634 RepID=A0A9P5TK53_GYMJU|nr:acetylornithine aminotransferase [Gymnopilus junonius]
MQATREEFHAFGEKHITKGVGRITKGIITKGEGSYVTYDDDRKLLDFTSGIGVTSLGHVHPKVSKAAADQCMQIVHAQCSIAMNEPYVRLIERLLTVMPHPTLDSFFFWNSGSEAVEAAIKMARWFTGRQNIICMQGAYHGRTFGAMAPGVFSIPYPYWRQFNLPTDTPGDVLAQEALYQLDLVLAQQTAPSDTAAIIVEPVLGEGGYVAAHPKFLQGLRKVCDKHGIMLIIDEVQCGYGRTGDWFAIQESGVAPDILVIAKGLGNGFPISGVVSRKELTDKLDPGSMGGTYAGNAVACAAAVAVNDAIKEENVLENVNRRSEQLFTALNALKADPDVKNCILDVRGRGLMVGVEFGKGDGYPANLSSLVAKKCIEKGLLILTTSIYEVVRFIPPLNISEEDMKKGIDIFVESVKEVAKSS